MSALLAAARPALSVRAVLPSLSEADRRTLLWLGLAFIAAVSVYDISLTYQTRDVILGTEENPLCRWLIALEPRNLAVFIPAKLAGTAFVVLACRAMYAARERIAMQVVGGLAGFQSWLLCYLTF